MLSLRTYAAAGSDTGQVLADLDAQIARNPIAAHFIFAVFGCDHDAETVHRFLADHFPGAAMLGGTSNTGLMTDSSALGNDAIGFLAIEDAEGQYGASIEAIDSDPAGAAARALRTALDAATCPGELPALVFVYLSPGCEEDIIDGLRGIVGDRCPIVGGSSADNDTSGRWRQIGPEGVMKRGAAVAVLFPSGGIGTGFQGGFEPAGPNGVVTRVVARRDGERISVQRGHEIAEIDGKPAATVYDEWSNHILGIKAAGGGNVFEETSGHPFGIEAESPDGVPHYLLVHPISATPEGGMTTFAAVEHGARIHIMRGNKSRLAARGGLVAYAAVTQLPGGAQDLAGGLMVYCAGCKRAVGERIPEVAKDVAEKFTGKPFLGCFTFGEQGYISGRNAHGNLMISAVAFGR